MFGYVNATKVMSGLISVHSEDGHLVRVCPAVEFVVLVADFGEVLLGHVVDPGWEVGCCD